MHSRPALDTNRAFAARPPVVASPAMRRSRRLALALSACILVAPALATAADPVVPADPSAPAAAIPSPFKADRLSSKPSGLTPDNVTSPVRYPDQPVVLTWGEVSKAAGYTVEIADNPGFSKTAWSADTFQPIAVPEILLADGANPADFSV